MADKYLSLEREAEFPQLRREEYCVTSCEDLAYNCIAHAAGRSDMAWWPLEYPMEGVYWPPDAEPVETVEAFVQAYATEGYAVCENRDLEAGIEKIAIYVDAEGTPTHAARQLADGSWTSKLGDWEDIKHRTLESLETSDDPAHQALSYGKVAVIMQRPRNEPGDGDG
jgi:hypothetical protein